MLSASRTYTPPIPPRDLLVRLKEHVDALEPGFIAAQKRRWLGSMRVDIVTWRSVSEDRASGMFNGAAGKAFRGLLLDLSVRDGQRIHLAISTPGWVVTLTWIFGIICLFPPFWPVLGLMILVFVLTNMFGLPRLLTLLERALTELAEA